MCEYAPASKPLTFASFNFQKSRSVITILFPIFASYKALRTSDPAQLTPWLMYWVVFSCFSLFDYWTYFIFSWIPFYAYLRLIVLSYLVLPQTQGAKVIYQNHVHPFIAHHELEIDRFIETAHDRALSMGLQYVKRAIRFVQENLLGMRPQSGPLSPERGGAWGTDGGVVGGGGSGSGGGYAQSLLSRFNLPSARQGLAAPAGDFYSLLSSAVGAMSPGATREAQVEDLSRSGTLIPQGMTSNTEKMTFLSMQRERLKVLLSALDKEASDLGTEVAIEKDVDRRMAGEQLGEGLKKSKSEAEFEEIGKEDLGTDKGSWMPWGWGSKSTATGVDLSSK